MALETRVQIPLFAFDFPIFLFAPLCVPVLLFSPSRFCFSSYFPFLSFREPPVWAVTYLPCAGYPPGATQPLRLFVPLSPSSFASKGHWAQHLWSHQRNCLDPGETGVSLLMSLFPREKLCKATPFPNCGFETKQAYRGSASAKAEDVEIALFLFPGHWLIFSCAGSFFFWHALPPPWPRHAKGFPGENWLFSQGQAAPLQTLGFHCAGNPSSTGKKTGQSQRFLLVAQKLPV